jgi:hypothetical protein
LNGKLHTVNPQIFAGFYFHDLANATRKYGMKISGFTVF